MNIKLEEVSYTLTEGNLIADAEFKPKFGEISIRVYTKDEDESDGKKFLTSMTIDKSQDLHDLGVVIENIIKLNEEADAFSPKE